MSKIHDAIKSRNMNDLIDAIEAGEDVNALNQWDNTPVEAALHVEVGNDSVIRNIEMIRILLTHPISRKKIDTKGLLPYAMIGDNLEVFNTIYCFGGDIHFRCSISS